LLSCSERWERADLILFRHEPLILDLFRCKMPIIKSLRLCADSEFDIYHPFNAPPLLTELDLLGCFRGWAFPWSQLTKLKLSLRHGETIEGEKLETILSQLQNVEEVHVYLQDPFALHMTNEYSIRLASLRLLASQRYPLQILERIEAPLLEHLSLEWRLFYPEQDYSSDFTEALSSFIRRSSCHIRRLTLHNYVCELPPRLMMLLSSVEELCINLTTTFRRGSLLVKYITQINDSVHLPNLRRLEVTCLRGQDDDEKLMTATTRLLETRSEESRLISVRRECVPFKWIMVRISMSFNRPTCLGISCTSPLSVPQ